MMVERDIFNDEIHVKIVRDHGGGSFKMSYQICNTSKLNSKDNTVVFSLFEAKDKPRANMKIGLLRYKAQADILRSMEWQ